MSQINTYQVHLAEANMTEYSGPKNCTLMNVEFC